jgi:hypothetical protein
MAKLNLLQFPNPRKPEPERDVIAELSHEFEALPLREQFAALAGIEDELGIERG